MTSNSSDTQDALILLNRAFRNQTVSAFGVDGHGQHGQATFARHFTITEVAVVILPGTNEGLAILMLDGFDIADTGHCSTDANLRISLNKLLVDQFISPTCWEFAEFHVQGNEYVALTFNVDELLTCK